MPHGAKTANCGLSTRGRRGEGDEESEARGSSQDVRGVWWRAVEGRAR